MPVYRYGWESAAKASYRGRRFEEAEAELERGWSHSRGQLCGDWHEVREATRGAWQRVRGE